MVITTQGNHVFFPKLKTFLFFRNHLWCFLVKNSLLFPSQVLCRRSDILWSLESLEGGGGASVASVRSALARAPRPVLHLLRSGELAKVDAEQREDARRMRSEPRIFPLIFGALGVWEVCLLKVALPTHTTLCTPH